MEHQRIKVDNHSCEWAKPSILFQMVEEWRRGAAGCAPRELPSLVLVIDLAQSVKAEVGNSPFVLLFIMNMSNNSNNYHYMALTVCQPLPAY